MNAAHLYKRFGDKVVLEDVSLTVPDGAVVCLMAPSGRGKTTLLRCIAGLEMPDSGTVTGVPERILNHVAIYPASHYVTTKDKLERAIVEIDKELESIPGIKDSTKAIAQFNKAEKEAQKLYAQIPFENGQITVAVKKGLANYGPAGHSSGARGMVTVHPENLGWEK